MPLPGNDALLALDPGLAHDRAASYDLLLGALEHLTEPIVLVIDDVHLAGPGLANGIVGVLAASAPPSLRLVLSGRGHTSIQLERFRYGEGLGELRAAELAFTREEVAQFACALGQDAAVRRRIPLEDDCRLACRRPRQPRLFGAVPQRAA